MPLAPALLVVGASARAAVESAAAIDPPLGPLVAIDQFGDVDLRESAEVVVSTDYPGDLPQLARRFPACPWIYTGALENHPQIVRAIAAERPLWGNDADVLDRVRDPVRVVALLAEAGLPTLPVRTGCDPPAADGRWVRRSRRSGAGRGISRWTATAARRPPTPDDLFQRFAVGPSFSAVFVAGPSRTEFVGASWQWFRVGRPFEWAGNVGPIDLPAAVRAPVAQIGERLTTACGLRGVFGCDFVLEDDVPRLVEVNPRYTASVEVLERALGRSLLAEHVAACDANRAAPLSLRPDRPPSPKPRCVAKRVLFAREPITEVRAWADRRLATGVRVADVPRPGTTIPADAPVCTLIVDGLDPADCRARLSVVAEEVVRRLGGSASTCEPLWDDRATRWGDA